ncbi:hypothetical protein LMG28727_06239 [Paraburkholderia kirstenboschensis]|uniref:hypothetical protein n=1 Tax=Paraburkholderia kirstenboschensis TaxID=1245436 RepID=UPI00191B4C73|nr:hypothetical protein [Paraburkholderia kirstenboschensis]CAD6556923.1 hypothetical protein LMG28727_06239 [Paraburkholderia kirstenboschensis]
MAGKSVTPFDLYRANLSLALQVGSFSHEARQQVSELEMQRIRRDLAAAHAIRNAVSTAHDWSEFSASYQSTVRDYMTTTTNLWQQGLDSAVRLQSRFSEGLREALANWQTAWSEQWPTHAPMNPVMLPWQEWLRRMESTAAGMAYGQAGRGDVSSQVTPATSAKSPASGKRPEQGEHHVG